MSRMTTVEVTARVVASPSKPVEEPWRSPWSDIQPGQQEPLEEPLPVSVQPASVEEPDEATAAAEPRPWWQLAQPSEGGGVAAGIFTSLWVGLLVLAIL